MAKFIAFLRYTTMGPYEKRYLQGFFKLSKHVHQLVKHILKFSVFLLKSFFISFEFNTPGVIAFLFFSGS